jgi:excinuclease ABC subunit C
MTEKLKNLIDNLSTQPGCYLMHDKNDNIIYVGKAKNLKNRVSQYFLRPQNGKVAALVSNVDYFETIVTKNESEAFLLEYNLIHKYLPKYNILLKDDAHYPYISLKKNGIPEIKISRKISDKNYIYFGPYPKASSAREMVDLMNQLFPLKKCRVLPNKPCLYYHLGQCSGWCVNKISEEENKALIENVKEFLSGKTYAKELELKRKIKENSENLNFEIAQNYKTILDSILNIKTSQSIELNRDIDADVFAFITRENYICLSLFVYRNGALIGKDSFIYEIFDDPIDTAADLIFQYYQKNIVPKNIVVFNETLNEKLCKYYENVFIGKSKTYLDILNRILLNCEKSIQDYFLSARLDDNKIEVLEELQNLLKLDVFPRYIELFDNSHISGSDAVSVSVAYINGEPCKKLYRKYKLNNSNTQSDVDNMKEILTRKFKNYKESAVELPGLLLMDGGISQVNIAQELLDQFDLKIPVFGLYKNTKHQTEGIIDNNGESVILDRKSRLFKLLTSMQNEVHRFAITFFRKSHLKSYKKTILDDIEGLGKARKALIFDTYENINDLYKADLNELCQLLPKEVAEKLFEKLHKSL